jgi:hypothetical protein
LAVNNIVAADFLEGLLMLCGPFDMVLSEPVHCMPGQKPGGLKAKVQFSHDGVHVLVAQPSDASASARSEYNSAHCQCYAQMLARKSHLFEVEASGKVSCPVIEIHIQAQLIEKISLLFDVSRSLSERAGDSAAESPEVEQNAIQISDLQLPCSVWGFVSLLLLLEGGLTVDEWFCSGRRESDASLPAQTLEVLPNLSIWLSL